MMRKCINCPWEGKDDEVSGRKNCPNCGDRTIETSKDIPEDKPDMDLTGDGVVDEKDRSLAAKVLSSGKRKKKKRKR